MSQPKEIYVKGTTATGVNNYRYLSQTREMIGWDRYHHNDVVEDRDRQIKNLKDSLWNLQLTTCLIGGVDEKEAEKYANSLVKMVMEE